jgi:hypothetical protein
MDIPSLSFWVKESIKYENSRKDSINEAFSEA